MPLWVPSVAPYGRDARLPAACPPGERRNARKLGAPNAAQLPFADAISSAALCVGSYRVEPCVTDSEGAQSGPAFLDIEVEEP